MVYFSDLTGKTDFIEKMVNDSEKKILILDFDLQFTALKTNGYLSPSFYNSNGPEILIPDQFIPFEIIDKLLETLRLNVIIVLDSLDGLMDYLNSKLIKGIHNFPIIENFDIIKAESFIRMGNNAIGHLALIFLKMLFSSPSTDKVTIIITSYVSQRSVDSLILKLANLESNSLIYETHFERLSQSISLLRYDHENKNLFYTRILTRNNYPAENANLIYPRSHQLK